MSPANEEIDFTEKCEAAYHKEVAGKNLSSHFQTTINPNTYLFGWQVETNDNYFAFCAIEVPNDTSNLLMSSCPDQAEFVKIFR